MFFFFSARSLQILGTFEHLNIRPRKPAWLSQKSNVQKLPAPKSVFEHCTFTTPPTIPHLPLHIRTNQSAQGFRECSNVRMFKHKKRLYCPKYRLSQCAKIVVKSIALLSNLWYTLPSGVVCRLLTLFFHNPSSKKASERNRVPFEVQSRRKAQGASAVSIPHKKMRIRGHGKKANNTSTPCPKNAPKHRAAKRGTPKPRRFSLLEKRCGIAVSLRVGN